MGMHPYQNMQIINVIRDLYFIGGNKSFAHQFECCFSIFEDEDGEKRCKVSIGMVVLIATRVSHYSIDNV
jgi:hypothetical protein